MINEDQLEKLAIQWFQDTGWSYVHGKEVSPDTISAPLSPWERDGVRARQRIDYREVVLKGRLAAAIARLNPGLPSAAVEEVVQLATKPSEPSLVQNNRAFHRLLLNGVPVDFTNGRTIQNEDDKPLLEYQLETLIRGFFKPEYLLEYLRFFVLFEQDGDRLIKKIAGYHQFHGVREAVRVTLIASEPPAPGVVIEKRAPYGDMVIPGSKKAGVFWHTQGSGKSISMACYAGMLLQQPEMNNPTLVLVTGMNTDRKELQDHIYTQQEKKRLEKRFKDPADSLKLVIVRDMWLTGFDAPCCHTMYIDKPMKGHNLAQSIARVNRVFKDKSGGLVVDYIGIAGDLKRAVKTYTDARGKGQPTVKAEEAFAILLEKMDVIRGMFHRFDYAAFRTKPLDVLIPAANHILGLNEGKKRYADVMASVTRSYSLCSTLDEAKALREE